MTDRPTNSPEQYVACRCRSLTSAIYEHHNDVITTLVFCTFFKLTESDGKQWHTGPAYVLHCPFVLAGGSPGALHACVWVITWGRWRAIRSNPSSRRSKRFTITSPIPECSWGGLPSMYFRLLLCVCVTTCALKAPFCYCWFPSSRFNFLTGYRPHSNLSDPFFCGQPSPPA